MELECQKTHKSSLNFLPDLAPFTTLSYYLVYVIVPFIGNILSTIS